MKAVVMEIKNGYAALLAENGRFIKVKDEGYQIGAELTIDKINTAKHLNINLDFFKRALVPCLALASFIFVAFGVKDFNTPYSVISLDVNPSIEISANRYDFVLDVKAVNEDAQNIVNEINSDKSHFKKLETVVETVLDDFDTNSYEAEDGTTYVVIAANSKKEEHSKKIVDKIQTIEANYEDISSTVVLADEELVSRASEKATTPGKLYLVDCLKKTKPSKDIDESEWLNKPVKDIVKEIESTSSENDDDKTEDSKEIDDSSVSEKTSPYQSPDTNDVVEDTPTSETSTSDDSQESSAKTPSSESDKAPASAPKGSSNNAAPTNNESPNNTHPDN